MKMKIASWNVNSVKARGERLLAFLKRHEPDVVCLQELKGISENFPFESVRAEGYHAAVYGQKTYNGVAVLSRVEPRNIVRGFEDGIEDPAARFLSAQIGDLTIASVYVPNGQAVGTEKYAYKLKWLERLDRYLVKNHSAGDSLILAGDFNVAPEDRDVYNPEAWRGQVLCSDAEREAFRKVCAFGLDDTFRRIHPEGGLYSWWDYRQLGFPKNHGLRIDFILATKNLADKCQQSLIDRDERKGSTPSDHAPVIAIFEG